MDRSLFTAEHERYRQAFRELLAHEVVPFQARWREEGIVSRETWHKAGKAGFLCPGLEREYGGGGGDFLHSVVIMEELARICESGFALALHSDVVVPYFASFGDEQQKRRWLPGCASGEKVTAIAMTEPGTGSDLAAITTTAVRDGDHYVLNGTKIFISNGILCDLCVVAAKTDPRPGHAYRGITLLVVEAGTPGFVKGKKLAKMGMMSQDTSELSFQDCRVPVANRLGSEGEGLMQLMSKLQQERLVAAIGAQASAEQALTDTVAHLKERKGSGESLGRSQNTQFKLAECATQLEVGRAFLDRLIVEHLAGKDLVKECSMAKLWHTEMEGRVADTCLQLVGEDGYLLEHPVTRAYLDARVQRIYAGTNEIMKVIIARQLGL